MEFLDCTSLTLDEFQQLVPPCEAAFHARMAAWRMDGNPRTARRFAVDKNAPLPTPEERLLFMLVSLKTSTLQVGHGRLCGMVQGKAHQWMHALLPALLAALRALGDAPARSLPALAQRLGVSETEAATLVAPLLEEPAPGVAVPAAPPASPLVPMTAPSGASSAPRPLRNRRSVRVARKRTIRSKMSCWSTPSSRSSFCATPTAAAPMLCASLRPPPTRSRPGVACGRIGASWRARSPRWSSSCRRRSPAVWS
jgi:hypothetical protein